MSCVWYLAYPHIFSYQNNSKISAKICSRTIFDQNRSTCLGCKDERMKGLQTEDKMLILGDNNNMQNVKDTLGENRRKTECTSE